jgi:transposase
VIRYASNQETPNDWIGKTLARHHKNIVAVALANKNARIVWALLTKNTSYEAGFSAV